MGLTKRKDGWYVEFPVVDDGKVLQLARGTPGAKVKRWKTGTTNKTLAKQQEAIIRTDLMTGKIMTEKFKRMTFAEWGKKYLLLEEVRSLRSYRDRVTSIQDQWMPFLGMKPMEEITAIDVEVFRSQRKLPNNETPTLSTVNNDHAILKHCLSLAERRGLVLTYVAKKVPLPTPNNERDRVLSLEEMGPPA